MVAWIMRLLPVYAADVSALVCDYVEHENRPAVAPACSSEIRQSNDGNDRSGISRFVLSMLAGKSGWTGLSVFCFV